MSPDKLSFILFAFWKDGTLCTPGGAVFQDQDYVGPHVVVLIVTGSSVSEVITLTLILFLFLTMSRTSKPKFFYCLKNVQANLYRLLFLFQLFYFSEDAILEMDSIVCLFFLSL